MEPVDDHYDRQIEQIMADIKRKLQPEDYLNVSSAASTIYNMLADYEGEPGLWSIEENKHPQHARGFLRRFFAWLFFRRR